MTKRVLARLAPVLTATATIVALAPAPHAAAYGEQCTNETMGGDPINSGNPTTTPPSSYRVTTAGVHIVVGPIAGVGTLDVRANTHEIGVALRGTTTPVYAGVEPGGGVAYGARWELAACTSVGGAGGTTYVDTHDQSPTRPGLVVRVFTCNPSATSCTTLLDWTGIEVDTAVPAKTCVWVHNNQQNPGGFGGICPDRI